MDCYWGCGPKNKFWIEVRLVSVCSKNLFELRRQFLFGGCLQLLELLGRNICARQNARRLQCRVGAWRENLVMG